MAVGYVRLVRLVQRLEIDSAPAVAVIALPFSILKFAFDNIMLGFGSGSVCTVSLFFFKIQLCSAVKSLQFMYFSMTNNLKVLHPNLKLHSIIYHC